MIVVEMIAKESASDYAPALAWASALDDLSHLAGSIYTTGLFNVCFASARESVVSSSQLNYKGRVDDAGGFDCQSQPAS